MYHTPWSKKVSSLPSDRIQPKHPQRPNTPKGKGKSKEPSKSKEVRKLESLLEGVRASTAIAKDPSGGCFCQARGHGLSSYSPICRDCGLILCALNLPQYACPHCSSSLLTPNDRASLVARLEEQVVETLAKEAEEREHLLEEARRAAGSFPSLTGATSLPPNAAAAPPPDQTHKVLSLNSKTKKVTVSSYAPSPAPSPPPSRDEETEEEYDRLPPPPPEVRYSKADPSRPWKNLTSSDVRYIPPPKSGGESSQADNKKKKRGRGGGKQKDSEIGKPGTGVSE